MAAPPSAPPSTSAASRGAAYHRDSDVAALKRLLQSEIDLQDMRAKAAQVGLDPDVVERGYYQLRDGHITIEQVAARIDAWSGR